MNAASIFYRLEYGCQTFIVVFTRYQIIKRLSYRKSDTTIIPPLQFLGNIMDRGSIETKASISPYGYCMLFTLLDVITRNCIDQQLLIGLQAHHGLGHVHLYFSTLHIDGNHFI